VNVNKRAVKQLPTPGDGKFAGLLGREFYTTGRQFFAAPASGGGTPSNFLLVSVDVYVNIHPVNLDGGSSDAPDARLSAETSQNERKA